ncbi:hypothetical protein FHX82_000430 [Amycolatopsis bartoniae]|uniref:PPE domain-containing protein n=1 Tax=Amycolatopsis bartoniae TaxID=941986 RepID=A0A8H9MAQ6_9PSEU|nr:hypothetical protein [Amycolatopsis bartoniae]MBB2933410.1 hypothetical protein [Amycolatopsis bartoniae]TVT06624.1 hypothetical protein FNH07_19395 [Amycolatopsis bartoniae]GHF59252.1 hypothetical protein GCM10017566_35940 [Amycolatopsis bartoniae]
MTNPQQPGSQGLDQYNGDGRYVSPQEAYAQELKAQGYDPNSQGFLDAINNFAAQFQAQATTDQQRAQQSRQLSQDVEFRGGLKPSNQNYLAIEHEKLKAMVDTVNPSQVTGVSSSWTQLANAMATFGQQLNQAASKSGATWKGAAAGSAFNFVSGLGTWSDQSGQAAQLAADQVYNQSSAAETAKNSMPEPIPFSWSDEVKSWATSNPFDLVDNIDKSLQKQQQSQDAHEQAAQVMSTYDNNLYSAAAKAPAFTPPPTFDASSTGSIGHITGGLAGTTSSSFTGPTGGNIGASGGHPTSSTGTPGTGSVSGILGSIATPPTLTNGVKTGVRNPSDNTTSAQGFQTSTGNSGSGTTSDLGATGLGAMGGMPMGAMGGVGGMGDEEYSSGRSGRAGSGSFGPGGSGSAAGSGSAGAGGQSGARAAGAGAAETAAGGGRGAAGAGRSGMGGMGAHGAKGKGEEDEEHQRPTWLVEPDPDDVFGTSERTAPPVIGE